MRSYLILGMCFLFLIQYFINLHWLQLLLGVIASIVFIGSVSLASIIPRSISILMFVAAILSTLLKGKGFDEAAHGVTLNLPLLTLLVLVPLLSIPFRMGGYFDSILLYLKQYQNNPRKMFMGITTVLFFVAPILSLGSIRIVHDLFKNLRLNSTLLSKAYLVGFSPTILWSPYYGAVGITLLYLNVSISDYMANGIGIALLFLVSGNVLFGRWAKKQNFEKIDAQVEIISPDNKKKIKRLPLILLALLVVTIIIESITHWSMLVIVSLLSIVFPLTWSLFSKQRKLFTSLLMDYRDKSVPIMNNEIIVYISAGFFGASLKGTTLGKVINELMIDLSEISLVLLILFIFITMICVTFVGIHQVVVVTVLATQMDPGMLGTTKEILAMVFMMAWLVSSILSPLNPLNLMVSGLVKKSGLQVGILDNGLYLLVVSVLGILILNILN